MRRDWRFFFLLALTLLSCFRSLAEGAGDAGSIRVASFNLANYLVTDRVVEGVYRFDYPKPEKEKAAVRAAIKAVNADVLAVQEIGDADYVRELQEDLRREGIDYPHVTWLDGPDEARHLAVFSRLPMLEVIAHTNLDFRYFGGRQVVKRGLLEIVFDSPAGPWRLFNLHLKSRYTDLGDDPQSVERRVGEARAIRDLVRLRQQEDGEGLVPLLVIGDFNDTRASRALRRFLEINGEPFLTEIPCLDSRDERWTHYYAREDVYSRVDYILASPALLPWIPSKTGNIVDDLAMREASDHRLIWVDLSPVSNE